MFCYPASPIHYVIFSADMQSLAIGGPQASNCDDGCIVTEVSSGSYTLTNNDGTSDTYGGGAFSISGSTLTWKNNLVFTVDACIIEGKMQYFFIYLHFLSFTLWLQLFYLHYTAKSQILPFQG